jgi:hypothetical protein
MPTERWSMLMLPVVIAKAEMLTASLGGTPQSPVVRRARKKL